MLIKKDTFRWLDCSGRAMPFCIIPLVNRVLKQCRWRMQINNAQSVNAVYSASPQRDKMTAEDGRQRKVKNRSDHPRSNLSATRASVSEPAALVGLVIMGLCVLEYHCG